MVCLDGLVVADKEHSDYLIDPSVWSEFDVPSLD